ncbi:MAG: ATP-dependent Clp protease proteolytic subunit [Planctomycetia bacterium]|nr:ATP-dependent Clp protease proteolytic subunit [Planctomycetia bacterium]
MSRKNKEKDEITEISIIGEISEDNSGFFDDLLNLPPGGECILYFDSPGGNAYTALALLSMIRLRNIHATGVVLGECSSAAILPFSACKKRYVTRWSTLLFHPMRWQSEEHVNILEAAEWSRHFKDLEKKLDELLSEQFSAPLSVIEKWTCPGKYVSGSELAQAGLAELIPLECLPELRNYLKKLD